MDPGSIFDAQSFLDASTTEVSVKRPPIPAGTDIIGLIKELKPRVWTGKKDPTQAGIAIDLTIEFDLTAHPDPKVRALVGVDKVSIVDGLMLNLTENNSIDYSPGKNGKLRKYREALGLNQAGQTFSIRQLEGRMVRCKIKHEPYEGDLYDKIDSVSAAA